MINLPLVCVYAYGFLMGFLMINLRTVL